ncbi:hypothetical protein Tco_0602354 [Tanacetum coccineum]
MFKDLGYIDGRLLFMHFRIPRESLDEGLLPLMSEEYVIRFLEYVPRFREVGVYIEIDVSLEFGGESGNIGDGREVDQDIYVEWKDDPYHLVDELEETEEINDMFAELDQAIDEPDQVIEAEGVTDLLAVYDQAINDEGDVVQVEVVAEEMVTEEAVDVDDGEHVVSDGDLIPEELYAAIVAQEGVRPVDDGDVIPDEVVTEIMLEDQTRSIKRRRVMADKENEDDA